MVTKVVGKNFKGRDFEVELAPKTVICGPNGTGKTAIIQALELAINGSIVGAAHKTNQAIYEAFASGEKMTVEATIGEDQAIGRQFSMDGNGSVPNLLMVNRRRADAKSFAVASAAAPRAVMVNDFLALSPVKMTAYLAQRFGGEDMDRLSGEITATNNLLNQARQTARENDGYISRSMAAVAALNLPPGSLAEIQDEMKKVEADVAAAQKALREAKAAEVKRKEEEARAATRERESKSLDELGRTAPAGEIPGSMKGLLSDLPPAAPRQTTIDSYPDREEILGSPPPARPAAPAPGNSPADSIQKIIDAIIQLGCPTCGGSIVLMTARAELRKWRK